MNEAEEQDSSALVAELDTHIREVRVPKLKFSCKSYHTIINWKQATLTEPPFIASLSDEEITSILTTHFQFRSGQTIHRLLRELWKQWLRQVLLCVVSRKEMDSFDREYGQEKKCRVLRQRRTTSCPRPTSRLYVCLSSLLHLTSYICIIFFLLISPAFVLLFRPFRRLQCGFISLV